MVLVVSLTEFASGRELAVSHHLLRVENQDSQVGGIPAAAAAATTAG